LQRSGMGKREARRFASRAFAKVGSAVSEHALERFQQEVNDTAPLGEADDKVISNAGRTPEDIAHYFIGLCRFRSDPALIVGREP